MVSRFSYLGNLSLGYRFSFNGKENDGDVKGDGNQIDYGMRVYDPRIAKFLSIDPLTHSYPWYTPYQYAGNKPVWATDLDGLEENTTSTYIYRQPVLAYKPTFQGVVSITDATAQTVHKTFEGDFSKLSKSDPSKLSLAIVNSLTGSNVSTSSSRLDLIMTGTSPARFSKSWKGVDRTYFDQFSYTFTNNGIVEKGTFEVPSIKLQASSRIWDPLALVVVNKVLSSILMATVTTPYGKVVQSTTGEELEASKNIYNGAKTVYRLGTAGTSATGSEAQFWALENPLTMSAEAFAKNMVFR